MNIIFTNKYDPYVKAMQNHSTCGCALQVCLGRFMGMWLYVCGVNVLLKGKQSQCLDHMGLTELIKSNNFQQQSYF